MTIKKSVVKQVESDPPSDAHFGVAHHDAPKDDPKPEKVTVTVLLGQLDDAFENASTKAQYLAGVKEKAAKAISAEQASLDAVKAEQAGLITVAEREADDARVALERVRQQVNERVGTLTGMSADPRVSVR